jgi:glutamate carboxypeptidase
VSETTLAHPELPDPHRRGPAARLSPVPDGPLPLRTPPAASPPAATPPVAPASAAIPSAAIPPAAIPPAAIPSAALPPVASPAPAMASGVVASLREAAVELLPWARTRLRQLVEHPSPNGDAAAIDAFGELLLGGHAETGAETMTLAGPDGDHLLACWPGADPAAAPALLVGHHDTAPGPGPCADDGATLEGPGALDGKSGLVVAEMAVRLLNVAGIAPAQQVRLLTSADATLGSPTARPYLVAEVARAGAVFGLAAPRPDGVLTTGRAGSARVLLRVAAEGEPAPSAIDELLDQIAVVRAAAAATGAVVNVGRLGGGTDAYAVADVAGAELGVRFPTPAAERAVLDAVSALAARRPGLAVRTEPLSVVPAWPAPPANPLLEWVAAVGERHGMAVVGAPTDPATQAGEGAGDTNHAGALGAPTLDGFGGVGRRTGGGASAREWIRIDSLVPRAVLLAALLALPLPPR